MNEREVPYEEWAPKLVGDGAPFRDKDHFALVLRIASGKIYTNENPDNFFLKLSDRTALRRASEILQDAE